MTTTERTSCPTGCGRTVSPGKMLCPPCWGEVPKHLQAEVYRTWRAYLKARRSGIPGAGMVAFEEWMEAREAAIGSIS